jgi:hypothetical protein
MKKLLILFLAFASTQIKAGEGMWLPHLLKALNESDMRAQGCKLKAEDIYSVNKGSLKDAIAHFGGFCTSEVISNQGLLLTNHHCGYDNIRSHSTLEKNYLKNGYWAQTLSDELPNPGLFARFIERIDDVTSIALAGVTDQLTASERIARIDQNIKAYREKQSLDKFHELEVKPFFAGNQYLAFFMLRYNDVRLVGTPPESIGKFGADTDNWVWPRHTGDFSVFRIYAGPNNEPADFSKDNKPFTPKHFLPISMDGISEGDFTMVFGFPGRTDQYLPSMAVDQLMNDIDPARIKVRDASLKILEKYMRKDEATRLKYSSKFASTANYWKKWIGEVQGLKKSNAVAKKKTFEQEFIKRSVSNPKYQTLFAKFDEHYAKIREAALVREYYSEVPNRNIELFRVISIVRQLTNAFDNGGENEYNKVKPRVESALKAFYKDFDPSIDQEVFIALMDIFSKDLDVKYLPTLLSGQYYPRMAKDLYTNSDFAKEDNVAGLLTLKPLEAVARIKNDPVYRLYNDWNEVMKARVFPIYDQNKKIIDSLQAVYVKAQIDLFPEKKFYPDANSTLRVTYGKVNGFTPKDGLKYHHTTYLDGVMEKYIPGDYEFDLDPKLLALHKARDYGRYADKTGDVPVCFLGSNHTTGGNSGSPAIDGQGNLVGLNFDRVWEGTMSDINYDASICRNIMVDARYVLFIIDKHAGATRLINEMKLVYPKSKKKS